MVLDVPYGHERLRLELATGRSLGVLDISDVTVPADPAGAVRAALEAPIGMPALPRFGAGERIVLLVSDSFRQAGTHLFLPVLLDGLYAAGTVADDISILFATGTHRPPTPAEQESILGAAIYRQFLPRIFCHNAADEAMLTEVGTTSRGTRVRLNRRAVEAARVIATGTVVLHYFGGFGGGRKSVVPGIAGVDTISHNHALNLHPHEDRLDPAVRIGRLDGNPVAEDMLEAARFLKVDYILNTVLDRHGRIAAVFAGELDAAHRAATEFARQMFVKPIAEKADLVIASAGGAKNFVQAHKALYNAYQAMKPGGRIIFLARCEEGLGAGRFAHWIGLGDRSRVIRGLRENSEINGQTALSTLEKAPSTILVSEMPREESSHLHMTRADSMEHALALARAALGDDFTYYAMPSASYTVPEAGDGAC